MPGQTSWWQTEGRSRALSSRSWRARSKSFPPVLFLSVIIDFLVPVTVAGQRGRKIITKQASRAHSGTHYIFKGWLWWNVIEIRYILIKLSINKIKISQQAPLCSSSCYFSVFFSPSISFSVLPLRGRLWNLDKIFTEMSHFDWHTLAWSSLGLNLFLQIFFLLFDCFLQPKVENTIK